MARRCAWLSAVLAVLLLAGCGQVRAEQPPEGVTAKAAVLEGNAASPDGRFIAQTEGVNERVTAGGLYPAEQVQITDAKTGEVLWSGDGAYRQSILWSPDSAFAALARCTRTATSVTVIETEGWTSWDFTLPDGSPIPEYTFPPTDEPWAEWYGEDALLLVPALTVVLGAEGDGGDRQYYRCTLTLDKLGVHGTVWEEGREALPGSYDFDHDGAPDAVELVTVGGGAPNGWYELRVNGWERELHTSHAGWRSYFACRLDGKDYLLRYNPTVYLGFANYGYEVFSLDEAGNEEVFREGCVDFDWNFGDALHGNYDPEAIIAFLEEVHTLLDDSELLVSTEGGRFRSGGSGAQFDDDLDFWKYNEGYDADKSMEENIRAIGRAHQSLSEGQS